MLPFVTSCYPLLPLLPHVTPVIPCYPCYLLLPLLPIVTPCYPLLPLLPFVTSYYPLLSIVTPCYPLSPLGTLFTLWLCYPLLLLVTNCRAFSLLVLHHFKIERMSNDLKLYPGLNADLFILLMFFNRFSYHLEEQSRSAASHTAIIRPWGYHEFWNERMTISCT